MTLRAILDVWFPSLRARRERQVLVLGRWLPDGVPAVFSDPPTSWLKSDGSLNEEKARELKLAIRRAANMEMG